MKVPLSILLACWLCYSDVLHGPLRSHPVLNHRARNPTRHLFYLGQQPNVRPSRTTPGVSLSPPWCSWRTGLRPRIRVGRSRVLKPWLSLPIPPWFSAISSPSQTIKAAAFLICFSFPSSSWCSPRFRSCREGRGATAVRSSHRRLSVVCNPFISYVAHVAPSSYADSFPFIFPVAAVSVSPPSEKSSLVSLVSSLWSLLHLLVFLRVESWL
jgi:hypothetical protein